MCARRKTAFRQRIQKLEWVKASDLRLNPYNWRKHPSEQREALGALLAEVGFAGAILTYFDPDHPQIPTIIDGHLRAGIADEEKVPCLITDLSRDEAAKVLATFDQITGLAEADEQILEALLHKVEFESDSLKDMFQKIEEEIGTGGTQSDDEVPEVPPKPKSKPGDIFILGDHRLLCGDVNDQRLLDRLIDDRKVDLVFSDPPYGIDIAESGKIGGAGKSYRPIKGDRNLDAAQQFYRACRKRKIKNQILWGGNYFTDFLTPSSCWIVWDKQNKGTDFADVELAWTNFKRSAKIYHWLWNGWTRKGDKDDELVSRVHPTQKPVGLFVEIFSDFEGATVLDGFGGSGSTLIACEKTGRSCLMAELDPAYCDVIIKRWEKYTGQKASLETS